MPGSNHDEFFYFLFLFVTYSVTIIYDLFGFFYLSIWILGKYLNYIQPVEALYIILVQYIFFVFLFQKYIIYIIYI